MSKLGISNGIDNMDRLPNDVQFIIYFYVFKHKLCDVHIELGEMTSQLKRDIDYKLPRRIIGGLYQVADIEYCINRCVNVRCIRSCPWGIWSNVYWKVLGSFECDSCMDIDSSSE